MEQRATPTTAENPAPRRVTSPAPVYPPEARPSGVSAEVTVRLTVDESGAVAEARQFGLWLSASGDQLRDLIGGARSPNVEEGNMLGDAFLRSALDAARLWTFEPPAEAPVVFNVRFQFSPVRETQGVIVNADRDVMAERARARAQAQADEALRQDPNWPPTTAGVAPIRVGGSFRPPMQTKHVSPVYPPGAADQTVQGIVMVDVLIGPDGRVAAARILSSIPFLDQSVLDAVRQWEYQPTLLNGVPVPVIMTVTVFFTAIAN